MNLRNIKISVKLFVSFLVASLLGVTMFYWACSSYTKAAEDLFYADIIDNIIFEEQIGLWQFMSGVGSGEDKYSAAHEKMAALEADIVGGRGKMPPKFSPLFEKEKNVYEKLYGERNFFAGIASARSGFIEKNGKHIRRILGYMKEWARDDADKRIKAMSILDLIRQERIYVDEFSPDSPDARETVNRFREANNAAVAELLSLWLDELDFGLAQAADTEMKSKIRILKRIVSKITATDFPSILKEEALAFGIALNAEPRSGQDAVEATRALNASCDKSFLDYENSNGKRLWKRADIEDVGDNVTPVFVLSKITSCQQGLRVNAEDMFRLNFFFAEEVDPEISAAKEEVSRLIKESSGFVLELASRFKKSFFVASAVMAVFSVLIWIFIIYFIIKPIRNVRDAASEIAKGNMDVKIDISGKDEVAKLSQAIEKMRGSLKMIFEEYEKKIKEKETKK